VVNLLQEAGVPAGLVQDAEDLSKDPQLVARNFFVHLEHPVLGSTISDRSPIRLQENQAGDWKAGLLLGEDNQYLFLELPSFAESHACVP
jgi:benzylsuccinate CoA-transferase BbsF subunit